MKYRYYLLSLQETRNHNSLITGAKELPILEGGRSYIAKLEETLGLVYTEANLIFKEWGDKQESRLASALEDTSNMVGGKPTVVMCNFMWDMNCAFLKTYDDIMPDDLIGSTWIGW